EELPSVTVILTVCDEAARIETRIHNILACNYPANRIQILVASDGSVDCTEEIVSTMAASHPVELVRTGVRAGKTATQNRALAHARGEIIVFTDAGCAFAPTFLHRIVAPFANSNVGGASGRLELMRRGGSLSQSHDYYWRYELALRRLESALGILAVSSGACLAVRSSLVRPMKSHVGEDCMVPLDVVEQGYLFVHCDDAVIFDAFEQWAHREFGSRVRMTLRNWQGTWLRPALLNPLRHPGYAFALWSHKLLRWLSPLFLITVSVLPFAMMRESVYAMAGIMVGFFYAAAVVGWLGDRAGRRVPIAVTVFSFMVANAAFLAGLCYAVTGKKITVYQAGSLGNLEPLDVK
ncbi:MAG: glycosyltransferase, partial [Betaproteobacteria bacterium]